MSKEESRDTFTGAAVGAGAGVASGLAVTGAESARLQGELESQAQALDTGLTATAQRLDAELVSQSEARMAEMVARLEAMVEQSVARLLEIQEQVELTGRNVHTEVENLLMQIRDTTEEGRNLVFNAGQDAAEQLRMEASNAVEHARSTVAQLTTSFQSEAESCLAQIRDAQSQTLAQRYGHRAGGDFYVDPTHSGDDDVGFG